MIKHYFACFGNKVSCTVVEWLARGTRVQSLTPGGPSLWSLLDNGFVKWKRIIWATNNLFEILFGHLNFVHLFPILVTGKMSIWIIDHLIPLNCNVFYCCISFAFY